MKLTSVYFETLEQKLKTNSKARIYIDLDQETINEFLRYINNFENLSAYVLKSNQKKNIVVRYKKMINEKTLKQTHRYAYQQFKNENYIEASKLFEKLIIGCFGPNEDIFLKAGISCYNIGEYSKAYNYLMIAKVTYIKKKYDYAFIDALLDCIDDKDKEVEKVSVQTNAEKWLKENDIEIVNESIININYLKELLFSYDEVEIDEFIKSNAITKDELIAIKLIIAEYYYMIHSEVLADKLIRSVEKEKDKSKDIKRYLEQIKANKKLYLNKANEIKLIKIRGL